MKKINTIRNYVPYSSAEYKGYSFDTDEMAVFKTSLCTKTEPTVLSKFVLIYITEGKAEGIVNNQVYPLQKGTLLWLFPFHLYFVTNVEQKLECISFEITLNILMYSSITAETNKKYIFLCENNDVPLIQSEGSLSDKLYELFTESLMEYEKQHLYFETMLLGNLYKIVSLFIREAQAKVSRNNKKKVWEVYQYIFYHFTEDISLSSVCHALHLPSKEIADDLKKITGKTFREILIEVRIINACSMMRFSDLPINFISRYVGYKYSSNFNRHFKKLLGVTPTFFRLKRDISKNVQISFKQTKAFEILQYIFEHFSEDLNSKIIANEFFSNSSKINQLLVEEFGYNFTQLLNNVRMMVARNLVLGTDKSIIEISYSVGCNSLRTFNRLFKNQWGVSPSVYRKNARK